MIVCDKCGKPVGNDKKELFGKDYCLSCYNAIELYGSQKANPVNQKPFHQLVRGLGKVGKAIWESTDDKK